MGAGRTGTVTFLFTDIEGSTTRWSTDEPSMAAALREHDRLLDDTITRAGGRVFKHTGDGVAAVFGSASNAVAAAVDAQRSLALPVRMGLHSGEAEQRDGDFFGPTLNRCARVMDAGHGGQTLISAATRHLLDHEIDLVDLGHHHLKGLDRPEHLYQVGPGSFPPLRTAARNLLPVPTSTLIGRDELVRRVVDELDDHRLVTLTGVGGCGKTRVAIETAQICTGTKHLVIFVDLGEVRDNDEVLPATCRSLSMTNHRVDTLQLALSGRDCLVVLDNCEHVLDGAAAVVDAILAVPRTHVLATSREGIAVAGERIVAVPGLPADGDATIQLFLDRSRSNSDTADGAELDVIRQICDRLDRLPLAIELAAARVGVLTPADVLERLDDRFGLLTTGRRRSRDRQRTLRETIDWSYELLDPDERDLFELMSVFGGSFTLASAVAMAGGRPEYEVLDLIGALIDKSLLVTVDVADQHRYRFLETIRSYSEDRFDERPDTGANLDRYQAHLVGLVGEIVEALEMHPQGAVGRLRAEIPNLRKAFDRAIERGDVTAAAELIGPLAGITPFVDVPIEGWAEAALALDGAAGSPDEAHLLAVHLLDCWLQGRFDLLNDLARRTEAAARAHDVRMYSIDGAIWTGYLLSGDDEAVEHFARTTIERAVAEGDERSVDSLRLALAWIHAEPASPDRSPSWTAEDEAAVASATEYPAASRIGLYCLGLRALRARRLADFDLMLSYGSELVELAVPGSGFWFAGLQICGFAEFSLGRPDSAIRSAAADIEEAYRVGDRSAMVLPLFVDALVLESLGELEAAATVRGRLPRRMTTMFIRELADFDRRLCEQLDTDHRRELATRGAGMDPRELQALTHRIAARHLDVHGDDPPH